MTGNPRYQNGHRRRQLRRRVLAEEDCCALCGERVDKDLSMVAGKHGPRCTGRCAGCVPHPMRGEIDEDIPVARGGSPLDRNNVALMHRECNRWKGARTLEEARVALSQGTKAQAARGPVEIIASAGW